MRFKADLTLLIVSIFWISAFVTQRVAGQMGCALIFVAVFLSQFKEWNLRGKMDGTHLVERR